MPLNLSHQEAKMAGLKRTLAAATIALGMAPGVANAQDDTYFIEGIDAYLAQTQITGPGIVIENGQYGLTGRFVASCTQSYTSVDDVKIGALAVVDEKTDTLRVLFAEQRKYEWLRFVPRASVKTFHKWGEAKPDIKEQVVNTVDDFCKTGNYNDNVKAKIWALGL